MTEDKFKDLLGRARAGETDALEELSGLMGFWAHGVARRELGPVLRRRLESMDVTQSVVGPAVQKLHVFRGETSKQLRAWLARQVVSRIHGYADYHGADKRKILRDKRIDTLVRAGLRGGPGTPSRAAIRNEGVERLLEALGEFPDEDRRILLMRQQGVRWQELANEFDMPSPDAARVRCTRLENRLAAKLKDA